MEKTLLVHAAPHSKTIQVALLEDGLLTEYFTEQLEKALGVGDIFLGRVKKIVGGLNAAFVDIGDERDGFLHYTDLTPNIRTIVKFTRALLEGKSPDPFLEDLPMEKLTQKTGKINEVLREGDFLPVQVKKEPISGKGARLSCEYSFAGKYLVLYPFQDVMGVSKKIQDKQKREALLEFVKKYKKPLFGLVARTNATNATPQQLKDDLEVLYNIWRSVVNEIRSCSKLYKREALLPVRIYQEGSRLYAILRDMMPDTLDRIVTDSQHLYEEMREYLKAEDPDKLELLRLHRLETPLFDFYEVTPQLQAAFSRVVPLPEGASVVIDKTEAFHVIDVNSGKHTPREADLEDTALKINLSAAKEIARQIRLRDMGGLILIDFIDMDRAESKKKVYEAMKKYMAADRAKHVILPLTRFNIMQITRERVRPEVASVPEGSCPVCNGKGRALSLEAFVYHIERNIAYNKKEKKWLFKSCVLNVHPLVAGMVRQRRWHWLKQYHCWVKVVEDPQIEPLRFRLEF